MQTYQFFVGIDISKEWFDASLTTEGDKSKMPHQRFQNTEKGFHGLLKWVTQQEKASSVQGKRLYLMEHTGIYPLPLCRFLQQHQQDFVLKSGLEIKHSLGIRRGKNDIADSKDIAYYAYLHRKELKARPLPCEALMQIKHLLSFRNRLLKYKTGLKVAADELALMCPQQKDALICKDTKELVNDFEQKIKEADKSIRQAIRQEPSLDKLYELVTSVKGIGPVIATTLLVYTNAFTAFDNVRKMASYCGIAPFKEQSGKSLNTSARISNLGYKKIKALLTNAAETTILHDKEIRAYYQRRIAEKKSPSKVINAIRFKILSRVFAVVKRGTPFVPLAMHRA